MLLYIVFLKKVSPARPGVGPFRARAPLDPCRFPRPSGGWPHDCTHNLTLYPFPPPVRGLARHAPVNADGLVVSPARPGVGPQPRTEAHMESCFPRPSGGWPLGVAVAMAVVQFPPPVRGLAYVQPSQLHSDPVSPARPGVGPSGSAFAFSSAGFPRPSGGWPMGRIGKYWPRLFPPPVRGLAPYHPVTALAGVVSPARPGVGLQYPIFGLD